MIYNERIEIDKMYSFVNPKNKRVGYFTLFARNAGGTYSYDEKKNQEAGQKFTGTNQVPE